MPGERAPSESWYFGCAQCGKCCNSAPQLTLPELFHHRARFVGCLGIRRRGARAELFLHAFSFTSQASCPALLGDGRCAIHDDRKPSVCSVVPLDPSLPDSEQHSVLAQRRREAHYFGADCIRDQPAPGFREVTRRLRVVDPDAQSRLAHYREEQADEERRWGEATARLLGPELFDHPERVRALPEHGARSISPVPVLAVMAEASPAGREQVLTYLAAQRELQEQLIAQALARKNPADRADTALLRKLLQHGQTFAKRL